MVDPSVLMSRRRLQPLQRTQLEFVVPAAFYSRLASADYDAGVLRAWGGIHHANRSADGPGLSDIVRYRREEVLEALANMPRFASTDADLTSQEDRAVRDALDDGSWLGSVHADEWTFLQTNSTMLSRWRRPIDAFMKAGSAVIAYGRRARDEFVRQVVPDDHIPPSLTPGFFVVVSVKWLVVGGVDAGGALLSGPVGAVVGLPTIPLIRAFDD